MFDFFDTIELNLNHVQVIVRAMYMVAKSDEVHQEELILIREFYNSCRHDAAGLADFNDVIAQDFDGTEASEILDTPELRRALLASCFLLAFADGTFSEEERQVCEQLGQTLGLDEQALDSVRDQVQSYLIQQISRIANVEAVVDVARELARR